MCCLPELPKKSGTVPYFHPTGRGGRCSATAKGCGLSAPGAPGMGRLFTRKSQGFFARLIWLNHRLTVSKNQAKIGVPDGMAVPISQKNLSLSF
jgi:hypothetical protein